MIIVTGMHKSGTTLISEWLHNSGIKMIDHFPLPNKLEYSVGNQFERLSFLNLNNYILQMRNKSSLHLPQNIIRINDNLLDAFHSVRDYQKGNWGAKDPRICLLLEEYIRIFPESEFIFVFRNPMEVARRYSKTNKINIFKSLKTWLVYNESILDFIASHKANYSIIEYGELLKGEKTKLIISKLYNLDLNKFRNKSNNTPSTIFSFPYSIVDKIFFGGKISKTYNKLKTAAI